MSVISFHTADRPLRLAGRTALKTFIEKLFRKEGQVPAQISYIFCSDDYLLKINRDFLQHDYYTDIITFGLSRPGEHIEAEIYISLDRVRDNAALHHVSVRDETLRVIFHGALHLCGYRDKTKKQIREMRDREDYHLRSFSRHKRQN